MLKVSVDRRAIDKAIAGMDLFSEVKKVIEAYQVEESKLNDREKTLLMELDILQDQHTKLLFEKDNTFEVSDIVYITKQMREINSEVEVINTLLEELENDKAALKIKFTPLFVEAIETDHRNNAGKYNANEIVDQLRYELIKAIADLSNAMQGQYYQVAGTVAEVFNDKAVKEILPRIENKFPSHHGKPSYGEAAPTVITPNDIRYAIDNRQVPKWIKTAGDSNE